MSRINESLLSVLLVLTICGGVDADLVNAYEYTLTTQSGAMPGSMSGTADIPSTQFSKGNATLTVLAQSALNSATPDLSTEAQLTFSVDPNSPSNDLWTDVDAEVRSESIMFDTATIQSGSYGGTSGQLQFHFSVDGTIGTSATSHLGTVAVEEMSASILLTSTLPGNGEVMKLELDHDAPNIKFLPGGSSFSIGPIGMSTGAIVYPTQWDQNMVGVQFTLHSILRLKAGTNDSNHFNAEILSDFYSTATLDSVSIMDDLGNWIPDATMTSTDGSNTYSYTNVQPVPEPSALLFGFVSVLGTVLWRFRPRYKFAR